jgi:hypothetical protein
MDQDPDAASSRSLCVRCSTVDRKVHDADAFLNEVVSSSNKITISTCIRRSHATSWLHRMVTRPTRLVI